MKLKIAIAALSVFAMSCVYANSTNSFDYCGGTDLDIQDRLSQYSVELSDPLTQVSYRRHYRQDRVGSLPRKIAPPGERLFVFSPRLKAWAAYLPNGMRVGYGRANGGAHWCAEIGRPCRTPQGSFRIQKKGSPLCKSNRYPLPGGGAPMPYCMYFASGYAIHGSPYISKVNSSHGCIRVQNKAAYWLSNYFMKIGTRVLVVPY